MNLLRILLRCSRLYKARTLASSILGMVVELRSLLNSNDMNDDEKVTDLFKVVSKLCKKLTS